jgi:predicted aspartyl protease
MVPVDLRKGSGGEGYYPYSALVHSGATYNFISQAVADRLGLEAVRAGRRKKQKKLPPPITTVNGETLRATAVVRQMVRIRNSARTKRSHAINIVVANIAHYDLILGMA